MVVTTLLDDLRMTMENSPEYIKMIGDKWEVLKETLLICLNKKEQLI